MSETWDLAEFERSDVLARVIATLAGEHVGVFAPEAVARCVRESYAALARQATIANYLPLLAERFARERLQAVMRSRAEAVDRRPSVLFVCTHNSGRSQIAAAWLQHLDPEVAVWSAGTEPGAEVSPAVVAAMGEVGVEMHACFPKPLTDDVVAGSDLIVTLGCGEACPIMPGRRYEDWILVHPVGSTLAEARVARDEIRSRVEELLGSMRAVSS
jgi:protein-tyrosine-phosphatase